MYDDLDLMILGHLFVKNNKNSYKWTILKTVSKAEVKIKYVEASNPPRFELSTNLRKLATMIPTPGAALIIVKKKTAFLLSFFSFDSQTIFHSNSLGESKKVIIETSRKQTTKLPLALISASDVKFPNDFKPNIPSSNNAKVSQISITKSKIIYKRREICLENFLGINHLSTK